MGVWIETDCFDNDLAGRIYVTPCVGVWIETSSVIGSGTFALSHPAWVCGLKLKYFIFAIISFVTPCVGVWIETVKRILKNSLFLSHPAWVCGLKLTGVH